VEGLGSESGAEGMDRNVGIAKRKGLEKTKKKQKTVLRPR
jgi:hypothetical protein